MDATIDFYGDIIAELAEAREFLAVLESGSVHIGSPFEGRTEAKIFDLNRQIAMWQSILERRHANPKTWTL